MFEPLPPSVQVNDTLEVPYGRPSVEIVCACFTGRCGGILEMDESEQGATVIRNGLYATITAGVTAPCVNEVRRVGISAHFLNIGDCFRFQLKYMPCGNGMTYIGAGLTTMLFSRINDI